MGKQYILSIDQGTSGTKTIIIDETGALVGKATVPLQTFFLPGGFVEQDPETIYRNVLASVKQCLDGFIEKGHALAELKACGISNQRETFIAWDAQGQPLYNAVVWQCKRSVSVCNRLKQEGLESTVKEKTGLIIDPYFSATKLIWLNEHIPAVQEAIAKGEAFFGTVDSWLLYRLTGGQSYYTDYTNASRTMFFNLAGLCWDKQLLHAYGLDALQLPVPKPSSAYYGETDFEGLLPQPLSVTAMIGDSHAAAFGEGCFSFGTAKATLGTGCSILMNTGEAIARSQHGMVSTICWSTEDRVDYALEGVIVSCGATIEWLKNELGLFTDSAQTESMANAVPDNNGVYLIPAFSGLGAPHWDMNRKAAIAGLTFGSNKNHIVRAALESIPYQVKDVIVAMESDAGAPLKELMVNGGMVSNKFVLQFLSDLLDKPVVCGTMPDVSALGAAWLAGLKAGVFNSLAHLQSLNAGKPAHRPGPGKEKAQAWYAGWKKAL